MHAVISNATACQQKGPKLDANVTPMPRQCNANYVYWATHSLSLNIKYI